METLDSLLSNFPLSCNNLRAMEETQMQTNRMMEP